jgi:LysM repeat protein
MRSFVPPAAVLLLAIASVTPLSAQSLRGSRTSVSRMYNQARSAELKFFSSGRGIRDAADDGALVRLQPNRDYTLDGVSYPYVRPATRTFVQRLAAQYRSACGERLVVTSAVRPLSLHLINSVSKTVHPTGMAVDLRRSNRRACRDWLRGTLLDLEGGGILEATEEHNPPHFHVAVFPGPYTEYLAERSLPAPKKVAVKSASAAKKSSSSSSAKRHVVRGGESLWGIARRNGTTVAKLKAANHLRGSTIQPGQTLVLP